MSRLLLASILLFALASSFGCQAEFAGDDDADSDTDTDTETDTGTGSGTGTGTGTSTGTGTGTGPAPQPCDESDDPCCGNEGGGKNLDRVGCNGDPVGPACENEYGGTCDSDPDSCGDNLVCWPGGKAEGGICLMLCPDDDASNGEYTTTGGCPAGSRCFHLDESYCFPDCASAADCETDYCDGEGSCNTETGALPDGEEPASCDADTDTDTDSDSDTDSDTDSGS